jgi:hypothetical protein
MCCQQEVHKVRDFLTLSIIVHCSVYLLCVTLAPQHGAASGLFGRRCTRLQPERASVRDLHD